MADRSKMADSHVTQVNLCYYMHVHKFNLHCRGCVYSCVYLSVFMYVCMYVSIYVIVARP